MTTADIDADDDVPPRDAADGFVVDVTGFEGPLDLLLALARDQKVDLVKISILDLAEQYLAFIRAARERRLEVAADYLVMAAWLAYLKSRLLLPDAVEDDEPDPRLLAEDLQFRLLRLEAFRKTARQLAERPHLGRDLFPHGQAEGLSHVTERAFTADLVDLLRAYAAFRERRSVETVRFEPRPVWSLAEAREALQRLVGPIRQWTPIDQFLVSYLDDWPERASILASGLGAALELVKEGSMEIRQDEPFGPLLLRGRDDGERQ